MFTSVKIIYNLGDKDIFFHNIKLKSSNYDIVNQL